MILPFSIFAPIVLANILQTVVYFPVWLARLFYCLGANHLYLPKKSGASRKCVFRGRNIKEQKQENRSGHNFGMTFRKCSSKVHNSQFFLLYTWDVCSEIDRRQLIFLGLCDWFHSRPNKETKEKIQSNFQFPIFVIDRFHDLTPTFISEGFSLAFFGPLFICILPARRYY